MDGLLKRLDDLIEEGTAIYLEERPWLMDAPVETDDKKLTRSEQDEIMSKYKPVCLILETEDTRRRYEQNNREFLEVAKAISTFMAEEFPEKKPVVVQGYLV